MPALFHYKNGGKGCAKSPNSCPSKREKDSQKKKGKFLGIIYQNTDGYHFADKTPWNKGKKFKGDVRWKDNGKKMVQNRLNRGLPVGYANTAENEIIRRANISKSMSGNPKAGGMRYGSGRGKKQWYVSPIAGKVYLRSSYELAYVEWLDKNNVLWKQNHERFPYEWNKKKRFYYPDFFLIQDNCFVEIKGYETKQDKAKWKTFPHKLLVLKGHDLKKMGLNVIL